VGPGLRKEVTGGAFEGDLVSDPFLSLTCSAMPSLAMSFFHLTVAHKQWSQPTMD
jgi:hypothetical protein